MNKIYLDPEEELFSIIDRIKNSREDDVILVIPGGLSALRSIINLRILKEEAISLGKNVSVITSDNLIKKLARQSGLEIIESVPQVEEIEEREESGGEAEARPRRVMSDIVIPGKGKPADFKKTKPELVDLIEEKLAPPKDFTKKFEGEKEEQFEELFEKPIKKMEKPFFVPRDVEIAEGRPSFKFFTKKRVIILLVIICLIVGGFLLYFVLPKAKIIITPRKETISFETEIKVDKNIDSVILVDNSVPGQVFQLEMEDTKKFPTTGEKDIEERAGGKITVYNQYSSSDQTLVKTTRFLSEEGKLFRLVETTVIPGATIEEGVIKASSKDVEVEADEPGESYNIGPSKFTIPGFKGSPKYEGFYGESKEAMTGGAKGKMRVATKDDIEGAIEIVSLELKGQIEKEFAGKIPTELKLLEGTRNLEIIRASSSLKADEPGKEFLITVRTKAWGLAFKEEDIFYLIEKNIGDKISENKILITPTIQVDYKDTKVDLEQGKANFSCGVEAEAAWKIDEETIKNDLAGKDEVGVRKYLSSLSEIETARVIFWPFWVKRIPKDRDKIKIIVDIK